MKSISTEIFRILQTVKEILKKDKSLQKYNLEKGRKLFLEKFSLEKLKTLDDNALVDTLFNVGNKNGLPYWLEFKKDKDFNTELYGSISGGAASKFIVFIRKSDNNFKMGKRIISKEKAIEVAREVRKSLVYGANMIEEILVSDTSENSYSKIDRLFEEKLKHNMFRLVWVHKYYHLLFPELIDNYHTSSWKRHLLMSQGIEVTDNQGMYELTGKYMNLINECKSYDEERRETFLYGEALYRINGKPLNYFKIDTEHIMNSCWEDMKCNNYISIDWELLGDLKKYESQIRGESNEDGKRKFKKNIIKSLIDKYPDNLGAATTEAARRAVEISRFFYDLVEDSIVVVVSGITVLGIGRITSKYKYDNERSNHYRTVEWIRIFDNTEFKLPEPNEGKSKSCAEYKKSKNIFSILNVIKGIASCESSYTSNSDKCDDLNKEVGSTTLESLVGLEKEISEILNRKKQVILYGPPGTGKTYNAEKACYELAARNLFSKSFNNLCDIEKEEILGNDKKLGVIRYCCFHQSYSYEDFIEGIKPKIINGQTVFEYKDGIFKTMCIDALKYPEKNFYLIIDEINRGDVSRIFGELILLIEVEKRGKNVVLPLTNTNFKVPANLYIIGTQNIVDHSVTTIDVAFRRRFGFIELLPDYSLLKGAVFNGQLPLDKWLKELNTKIRKVLGRESRNLQIGHAYFLEGGTVIHEFDLFKRILKEDIIPLVEDYCYGDYERMSEILGDDIINKEEQVVNCKLFNSDNENTLISALLKQCPEIRSSNSDSNDNASSTDEANI